MTAHMLILTAVLATSTIEGQATIPAPPKPSSNTADDRLASVPAPAMVTVEGCIVTRREVLGGPTDLGERIGLNDHFRLTNARVIKGRAPAGTAPTRGRPMYVVAGLSDEQLKPHLGHRVRIEGSFAKGDGMAEDGKPGPLAALTATTVRQIPGDCPIPTGS
jgi:hypothetical protein